MAVRQVVDSRVRMLRRRTAAVLAALLTLALGLTAGAPAVAAEPVFTVTFTVTSRAGTAVPDAGLTVADAASGDAVLHVRTDAQGRAVASPLPAGSYTARLHDDDPVAGLQPFEVVDADLSVPLTPVTSELVHGVVVDSGTGKGIAAQIEATTSDDGALYIKDTAADGSFAFLMARGSYTLQYRTREGYPDPVMYYPGVLREADSVPFVVDESTVAPLRLTAVRQPRLGGEVRLGGALLRGDLSVTLTNGDEIYGWDGRYVSAVKPGTYSAFVGQDGRYFRTYLGDTVRRPDARKVTLQMGDAELDQDIDLVPTARVSGTVTGPTGRPLPYAHVYLQNTTRAGEVEVTADRAGRFSATGLASGPVRVVAGLDGALSAPRTITLTQGKHVTGVVVRANLDAVVWGQIRTPGSSPTTQDVSLFDSQRRYLATGRPDRQGYVGWGGLAAGTYYVSVDGANLMRSVKVGAHGVARFGTLTRGRVVEVTGVVRSSSGIRVKGAKVSVTDGNGTLRTVATTDSTGRYRVAGAVSGSYEVQVVPPRSSTDAMTFAALRVSGGTAVTKDVRLARGGRLTGLLVNSAGKPAVGVHVTTFGGRTAVTNSAGRWTLTGVTARSRVVWFSDDDYVGGYRNASRAVTVRAGATVTVPTTRVG